MKKTLLISTLLLASVGLVQATPGTPTNPADKPSLDSEPDKQSPRQAMPRGQLLYQNHCTACHESNVHIRDRKKARNLADITMWVTNWSQYRKLGWSTEEIRSVRDYLNEAYYKYSE